MNEAARASPQMGVGGTPFRCIFSLVQGDTVLNLIHLPEWDLEVDPRTVAENARVPSVFAQIIDPQHSSRSTTDERSILAYGVQSTFGGQGEAKVEGPSQPLIA